MAGKMKRVLAIDLGASSGRAIVFESDGESIDYYEAHRFDNNCVEIDGKLKWDINRIFDEILKALENVSKKGIHIDSIGIDTWGVDYGIIGIDGKLVDLPYCYRDKRTSGAIDKEELYSKRAIYDIAGISLNEFNTSYQLIAEQKERKVGKGEKILFIPYLLAYMLTGEMTADVSMASTTGFYTEHGYSREFLDKVGLDESNFPPIKDFGEVIGNIKCNILKEVGIDYDIPVLVTASHDTASAIMTIMNDDDTLYLSSGTWSLFGTLSNKPIISDTTFNENYTNERGFMGKVTLLKNIMGMWIIQECRREWNKVASYSWDDIVSECKKVKAFNGFINVGDSLFNAPFNMDSRIVKYVEDRENITLHGVGEIARCVYNSLALEYRYALDGLCRITGKKYSRLHIIGGGTRNELLNQLTSDALGVEVVSGLVEATAIGNGMAQLYGLHVVNSVDDIYRLSSKCYVPKIFTPNKDRKCEFDRAYMAYLQLKEQ